MIVIISFKILQSEKTFANVYNFRRAIICDNVSIALYILKNCYAYIYIVKYLKTLHDAFMLI